MASDNAKQRKFRPLDKLARFSRFAYPKPIPRRPYLRLSKAKLQAIIERLHSPWLDVGTGDQKP
jgi:hypothetical protein